MFENHFLYLSQLSEKPLQIPKDEKGSNEQAISEKEQNKAEDTQQEISVRKNQQISRKSRKKPEFDLSDSFLTIGQKIGIRRRQLGLSQEELGEYCERSRTEISRIERDLCDPKPETIEKLETALDMDLFDMFMNRRREKARKVQRKENKNKVGIYSQFKKELSEKGLEGQELIIFLREALETYETSKNKNK